MLALADEHRIPVVLQGGPRDERESELGDDAERALRPDEQTGQVVTCDALDRPPPGAQHAPVRELYLEPADDVCVPRSALADLVTGVADIARRCGLLITCSGHAGDGNMHPPVIFDGSDDAQVRRAREAFESVMALGLQLGGTITGEHGVGTLKASWLARELGSVGPDVHRGIKGLFDPHGILNPGKVLSAPDAL